MIPYGYHKSLPIDIGNENKPRREEGMISWNDALDKSKGARPELAGEEQREIAFHIFVKENLLENNLLSSVIAVAAVVISIAALLLK